MKLLVITQIVDSEHPILGFFHRWVEEFAQRCDTVHVLCLEEGKHDLPKNVCVHSLGKEHGVSRFARLVHFYRYIWSSRREYDAVFVHMNPVYVVLGGTLWRLLGKKVSLWYTHGTVTTTLRTATLLTHIIFTASTGSFRIKSHKVQVVGHGIDTDLFKPLTSNFKPQTTNPSLRLVTVGRISRIKRQDLAVRALGELRTKDVDARLSIIGTPLTNRDRIYETELQNLAHGFNLEEHVFWRGAVSNAELPKHLHDNDILIHTSETGSLDKVVLEALASGLLLVTTSESVRATLPLELGDAGYVSPTAENIAERANSLDHHPGAAKLRELGRTYVEMNHGLSALMGKILDTISR